MFAGREGVRILDFARQAVHLPGARGESARECDAKYCVAVSADAGRKKRMKPGGAASSRQRGGVARGLVGAHTLKKRQAPVRNPPLHPMPHCTRRISVNSGDRRRKAGRQCSADLNQAAAQHVFGAQLDLHRAIAFNAEPVAHRLNRAKRPARATR